MAEDTPQAQSPVKETPETPMPGVQKEEKTLEAPKAPQDGLPESASDRTKGEFEKLQTQLRGERQRREQIESAFKALSQPKASAQEPIYDPVTGLIDGQQLTDLQKRTFEAEERAKRAEGQVTSYLKNEDERKAYAAHPWMDPDPDNKKFDQEKYNLAAGIALASMVNPDKFGGKQLDLKGAGDYVAKLTTVQVERAKEEAAQQAIEQLSPKEQAALEATGTAGRREGAESAMDYDTVREVTRKGGSDSLVAIMARLKALKTQA